MFVRHNEYIAHIRCRSTVNPSQWTCAWRQFRHRHVPIPDTTPPYCQDFANLQDDTAVFTRYSSLFGSSITNSPTTGEPYSKQGQVKVKWRKSQYFYMWQTTQQSGYTLGGNGTRFMYDIIYECLDVNALEDSPKAIGFLSPFNTVTLVMKCFCLFSHLFLLSLRLRYMCHFLSCDRVNSWCLFTRDEFKN